MASRTRPANGTASASGPKSRRGYRIFGIVLGGLIFLTGAILLGVHVSTAAHASPVVTAHVVGAAKMQRCAYNAGCHEVYPPKVRYSAGAHGAVTTTVSGLEPSSPIATGSTLQIRYDTSSPTVAHQASVSWWGTWGVPSVIILFGLLLVWAAIPARRRSA